MVEVADAAQGVDALGQVLGRQARFLDDDFGAVAAFAQHLNVGQDKKGIQGPFTTDQHINRVAIVALQIKPLIYLIKKPLSG